MNNETLLQLSDIINITINEKFLKFLRKNKCIKKISFNTYLKLYCEFYNVEFTDYINRIATFMINKNKNRKIIQINKQFVFSIRKLKKIDIKEKQLNKLHINYKEYGNILLISFDGFKKLYSGNAFIITLVNRLEQSYYNYNWFITNIVNKNKNSVNINKYNPGTFKLIRKTAAFNLKNTMNK